jgi:hypothetical protein
MADFQTLKAALTRRPAPSNGPNKSEDWNDFMEETLHDMAEVFNLLNTSIIPAFNGLGMSGTWPDVDPIANGIDGSTVMTDRDSTSEPYYYDSSNSRPRTILETFARVVEDLDSIFVDINVINGRLGVSTADSATSSATLAELETKVNSLNATVFQLQSANDNFVSLSGIQTAIEDQTLNPSSFHIEATDIEANTGISPQNISGIDLTTATPVPADMPSNYDMRDTVLRLKGWVEDEIGDTFISYSGTNLNGPTLREHIISSGTGVVSSGNPHGLDINDLTDASNLLTPARPLATFDVRPSGNQTWLGGYEYVAAAATVSKIALTVGGPGVGLTVEVWKRSAGSNSLISGLAVTSTPIPGSNTTDPTGKSVAVGDLLFVSGIVGDGTDARIAVFGA